MENPSESKAKNPNMKVFTVLTPAEREVKVRAESFSVSPDGTAINFSRGGKVVSTFALMAVVGVASAGALVGAGAAKK